MALNQAYRETLAQEFVAFCLESGVLKFGEFVTKAGRHSPYFFNAGLFNTGAMLARLASFYADALEHSNLQFDMIFGPAYKGIPLGAALATEWARRGRDVPFAYNRKEMKDHGEGGVVVGAPLKGRILIVDDVMSAGTAARESVALIQQLGATPSAMLIALDRQEMATEKTASGQVNDVPYSAVQYVQQTWDITVDAIANLGHLLTYLTHAQDAALQAYRPAVLQYRQRYGV